MLLAGKGRISAYCLLHTVFPPTIVHTIFVSFIFSAGILNKSSDSTTRSAYFPGVIDPRFCSTKFANAPLIVYARIAVSRSIVCAGTQPPSGLPSNVYSLGGAKCKVHARTTRVGTRLGRGRVGISWGVPEWDLLLSALENFIRETDVVINAGVESRVTRFLPPLRCN